MSTFTYRHTIRVVCNLCFVDDRTDYTVSAGNLPRMLVLPDGWHVVDGQPICPKHVIKFSPLDEEDVRG